MEQAPGDPTPYVALVKSVYGPDRDMQSARAAMDEAVKVGNNDPYDLDLALAEAAREARDASAQESALKDAVAERPEGSEVLLALGEFYLKQSNYDRAALTLQQAVDAEPSARAFFDLGRAQEGAFNYDEAEKAYEQAAELDPGNRSITDYYAQFKHRIAKAVAAQTAAQSRSVAVPEPAAAPTSDADN
jgi:Flp pilus assembly protein TadD